MEIELKRYRHTINNCARPVKVIDGILYIDGVRICDTAEHACHCLPDGSYHVVMVKCHQHARKMPVVKPDGPMMRTGENFPKCHDCRKLFCVSDNTVMPRYCPQLCPGNGVHGRTDGAIILGTCIAPGCLKLSKEAFNSLYERIRKSEERGNVTTLVISTVSGNHLPS